MTGQRKKYPSRGKFAAALIRIGMVLFVAAAFAGTMYSQYSGLLAAPRNPNWAMPISLPGSRNFYQVSSGVYRCAQPSAEAFRAYEKLGLKTVINLRSDLGDSEFLRGTSLRLVELPVPPGQISDDLVIQALRLMNENPQPVLVHCYKGADRTGAVVAAYRIVVEGWSKEAAIDELVNGGYNFNTELKNIPDYLRHMDVAKIRAAVLGS